MRGASIRSNGGALITSRSVMPVIMVISGGMGRPGLTSVVNSSTISPSRNFTAPTSMIASFPGSSPVVSRSSAT